MKLSLLLAAGLGIAIVLISRVPQADASCGSPNVGFSPASGATVPPRPTIYVFIPRYAGLPRETRVVVEGAEASVEPVSKSHAYEVVRVRVSAHEPGHEFTMRLSPPERSSDDRVRYQIGDTLLNRARVTAVTRQKSHWTCSFTDTILLDFEGTALAYRLAWTDGSTTIVPADDGVMWLRPGDQAPQEISTAAELGHLNCMGYSVDPELLATSRAFDLYALFADGSEIRIGSSVAQLGDDGVRLPTELVNGAPGARMDAIATPLVAPPWWTAVLGALGGAVALLGVALLGRRRRRDHTPRQPPRSPS